MNKILLKQKYFKLKGFTLVEVLVVLALFSSIMTIAAGALFTTQAINTKLQETQSILDNVNLSMETMIRDVRYGASFHCDTATTTTGDYKLRKNCEYRLQGGVVEGGAVLFFKPNTALSEDDRVAYYVSDSVLYRDEYVSCVINGTTCTTGMSTTTYQITGDDVDVKSLVFYVTGANTSDLPGKDVGGAHDFTQPLVTLTLAGQTKPTRHTSTASSTQPVKFTVQTSISSRVFDN